MRGFSMEAAASGFGRAAAGAGAARRAARLKRVDVEDDEVCGPAAAERDIGQDAREGERGGNLALELDALRGAGRKEGQHKRE